MIYKLDHIGITVPSLSAAQDLIEGAHPCFHTQRGLEVRPALSEVSIHKPKRFDISLHQKDDDVSIELIKFPRVSKRKGSMFPWWYDPEEPAGHLESLKEAVREQVERSLGDYGFADLVALMASLPALNAVVVPVQDLAAEERFWERLRFEKVHSDGEVTVLRLKSILPPARNGYLILCQVDFSVEYHTDTEGINEIALLCSSCSADLRAFPGNVFKSSVDTQLVNGKEINLGYLRSPSGVLAELFSVRLVRRREIGG